MYQLYSFRVLSYKLAFCLVPLLFSFQSRAQKQTEDQQVNSTEDVEFDTNLLRADSQNKIDLRRFAYGANVLPGNYRIDILVNEGKVANENVTFKENNDKVTPCLTASVIDMIKINPAALSSEKQSQLVQHDACIDLSQIIPEATVEFDAYKQQLNITVPQIYVQHAVRGYVDPKDWDSGIPALMLGYYMNSYSSHYSGGETSHSFYGSLNAGLNIGSWYFRHNGSYSWDQDTGGGYQSSNTYVQRDTEFVRGRLYLGQYFTSGELFNTVSFTGAELASDERMLPASQRGYAPEIRGVAKTNAKVTIRQSGNIIYETTVPPGAFDIDDLYPTGYGGDLDVTVQEADGSKQQYTVPYAAVAQSLRPGAQKFSMIAGKLRDDSISDNPLFYEATYMRGLTNLFTGYGGVQVSEHYHAVQAGAAVGAGAGAISADVTQSWSQLGGGMDSMSGQSYRVSYSKLIQETDSNITIAAYRYSSSGYMDLQTAVQTRDAIKHGDDPNTIWRAKNQFSLSLNQGLPAGWGNIYVSAAMQNYWNSGEGYNTQYQMGYSNSYKWVNYSINISRNKTAEGQDQTTWYLNLSMPLWGGHQMSAPYLSMRYNHDNQGGEGEQANLSGSFGGDSQYNYNVSANHDNYSGSSGGIALTWQNSLATVDGSYSGGNGYNSSSLGLHGGLVAHSGGVTFSPYTSDTYALIEAKGASGAKVPGAIGAAIDNSGYALFPSMMPYQLNHVVVDPEGSDLGVEFESTSQDVAPRTGAVVKVEFATHAGTPILITSRWKGEPLPFGADVFDDSNTHVGAVSQGGVIYAKVNKPKGTLTVKWGEDVHSQCKVPYALNSADADENSKNTIQRFTGVCQ